MQSTSQTWKDLWASGTAWLEARVTIGGASYTGVAPTISRAVMQSGPQIGNAVAASCAFTLRDAGVIPRSGTVAVETRLTDGATASEWLPAGTFHISRRSVEPVSGALSLECYDALLKADAVWEPSAGNWPRDMAAVAGELAEALGLQIDPRSAVATGGLYVMNAPDAGTTLRAALSTIAAASRGNWIVSPAGKLRLVPFAPGGDTVPVAAVLSSAGACAPATVTGVRCGQDNGEQMIVGDATGIVLDVALPATLAAEVGEALIGQGYQGYSLAGAVYDPAAELGDRLTYGAGVDSALYSEIVTLGPAPRGDISAPEAAELADEYPYLSGSARALTLAKAYAREAVAALDDDLTQQEIFNRLTDSGAAQGLVLYNGQLYVNASYINAGELSANRISGGTLTLGGANNINGTLRVLDTNGNSVNEMDNQGLASYSVDRLIRAFMQSGAFALQVYDQGASGAFAWNDQFSIRADGVMSVIQSRRGALNLFGYGRVLIDNQESYRDRNYASVLMQDDAITITLNGTDNNAQAMTIAIDRARGVTIEQVTTDHGTTRLEYDSVYGDLSVTGRLASGSGATGAFRSADGKAVSVNNGIVTEIV